VAQATLPAGRAGPGSARAQARATGQANPWINRALALAALFALDHPVREAARDIQGDFGQDFSSVARRPGDAAAAPVVLGSSLLIGSLLHGKRPIRRTLAIAAGIAAGEFANESLNQAVGRQRPNRGGHETFRFDPFSGHSSFPSGHSAFAFAIAGAVDAATDSRALAGGMYAVAGMTAASRVYDDRHWLSDVVVAAVIGREVSRRVTAAALGEDGRRRREQGAGSLSFVATPAFIGFQFRF